LRSGADDYNTKPFKIEELIEKIRAILRRHQRAREQGLAEAEEQVDQLRRFLNLAAQWIPADLSSVQVSGPTGEPQRQQVLTPPQLVEILDTIGSELARPMGVICTHLHDRQELSMDERRRRREIASALVNSSVSREHYMFQIGGWQNAVFIPNLQEGELPSILEQMRERTQHFNASENDLAPLSFAIGVFVGEPGSSLRQLWEKADTLMRSRIKPD